MWSLVQGNLVRGLTGHLGNLAVTALDEVMWDERANGPKPFPRTLRLLTGIHSLQPPKPRTYTCFGNEFYENSDWAEGRARSVSCSGGSRVPAVCVARTLASRTSREASELRRREPPPEDAVPPGECGSPGTVDVNRASESELDRLPGIGPVLAARIVDEREAGGPFASYLDLQRVRGIGPVTVERMRGMACAGQ